MENLVSSCSLLDSVGLLVAHRPTSGFPVCLANTTKENNIMRDLQRIRSPTKNLQLTCCHIKPFARAAGAPVCYVIKSRFRGFLSVSFEPEGLVNPKLEFRKTPRQMFSFFKYPAATLSLSWILKESQGL